MSTLLAFSPDQVCRVTGLSRRQLTYWNDTGFFSPRFADRSRRRFAGMYSFKDVVGLRTLAKLRDRLPLQELRRVGEWLSERYEEPWSSLRFFVVGRRVVFEDAQGLRAEARTGQTVLPVELGAIELEADIEARKLLDRSEEQIGRIVRNRYVQHNAWVLDGTRIPTAAVWDFHDAGYATDEIRREYPRLTQRDIEAAIEFERQSRSEPKAG
ncbi:MAG: DUF433 domain-containing protein [Dehalococcoidia bacterium]